MRSLNTLFLAAVALAPAGTTLADENDGLPTLMEVLVHNVFVPVGFDDNDEVTVVLDGYLPTSCYKLSHHEVSFDETTSTFTIKQYARRFWQHCRFIKSPFTTEIALGVVPHGAFRVAVPGSLQKTLGVAEALNAGPDDHLYAPVDAARVEADIETGRRTAVITGRLPSTCMKIDELRLVDSGETLQLLPITRLENGPDCRDTEEPFEKTLDLPPTMTVGRHLLHVRSLNGKAVNVAFSVAPPVGPR